jgi:hypothetical protein
MTRGNCTCQRCSEMNARCLAQASAQQLASLQQLSAMRDSEIARQLQAAAMQQQLAPKPDAFAQLERAVVEAAEKWFWLCIMPSEKGCSDFELFDKSIEEARRYPNERYLALRAAVGAYLKARSEDTRR